MSCSCPARKSELDFLRMAHGRQDSTAKLCSAHLYPEWAVCKQNVELGLRVCILIQPVTNSMNWPTVWMHLLRLSFLILKWGQWYLLHWFVVRIKYNYLMQIKLYAGRIMLIGVSWKCSHFKQKKYIMVKYWILFHLVMVEGAMFEQTMFLSIFNHITWTVWCRVSQML